ncbi:MAG: acetyltransferase, partial [Planctomycetota bacterium]
MEDSSILGPLLIVGASHQGEVVLDLLRSMPRPVEVLGFLDSGPEGRFVGRTVGGVPVLDTLDGIARYQARARGAIPAVGSGSEREGIAAALERARIPLVAVVHPAGHVSPRASIGPGSVIHAGAILGVGVQVGRAAIINSGAILEHHTRIGDYAHVAPGARLAGGVRVGERAWVGLGATVLEDRNIGPDAVVGAGAVVTRDGEAARTVIGMPARATVVGETL